MVFSTICTLLALQIAQLIPVVSIGSERVLSLRPLILEVSGFATQEECTRILDLMEKCRRGEVEFCTEQHSKLIDQVRKTGGSATRPIRNSTSFELAIEADSHDAVDDLLQRAHVLARQPLITGEGVQMANYGVGDYYELHHDGLRRRATFLLYLTDVLAGHGGETIFPLVRALGVPEHILPPLPPAVLGWQHTVLDFELEQVQPISPYCEHDFYLRVRPEAGKALLFFSYSPDRTLDEYAFHAACPLHHGRKAILQRWMHFESNSLFQSASKRIRAARMDVGLNRVLPPGMGTQTSAPSSHSGRVLNASDYLRLLKRHEQRKGKDFLATDDMTTLGEL